MDPDVLACRTAKVTTPTMDVTKVLASAAGGHLADGHPGANQDRSENRPTPYPVDAARDPHDESGDRD